MPSLVKLYGRQFRRHLSYHPVWQPGTAIVPGDFGRLHDGVFVREGHAHDVTKARVEPADDKPVPGPLKFSAGISLSFAGGASAQLDPSVEASASLRFDRGGGVVFHARDVVQRSIINLHALLAELPWGADYWRDAVLVSEVQAARTAAILVSENDGGTVEVSGKAGALRALELADASVGLSGEATAGYSLRLRENGGPHPVALRLYQARPGWFSIGRPRPELLEAGRDGTDAPPPEAFEELSPHAVEP